MGARAKGGLLDRSLDVDSAAAPFMPAAGQASELPFAIRELWRIALVPLLRGSSRTPISQVVGALGEEVPRSRQKTFSTDCHR
jgi:hypothetical protein